MFPFHRDLVYPPVKKKAGRGFHGYPAATLAFYGPDDSRATKAVVALIPAEDAEPTELEKLFVESGDVRRDPVSGDRVLAFLKRHGVVSVILAERVIGCPHEEGIDYPEGAKCPSCPFWHDKDRWTGETLEAAEKTPTAPAGEPAGDPGPASGESA